MLLTLFYMKTILQAVTANHENVLVTHDATLTAAYAREFQLLWAFCDDVTGHSGSKPPLAPAAVPRLSAAVGTTAPAPFVAPPIDARSGQRAVYRIITATSDVADAGRWGWGKCWLSSEE